MYGIYNIEHTKLDRKNEIVKLKKALNKWQNILNKAYIRSILCLVICSVILIVSIFLLILYQNVIASGITNVISAIYGAGSFSTLIANLKILYDLYIGSKSDKQDNKKEEISDDLVKKSLKNHPDSLYSKIKFLEAIGNNIRNLFTWQTILTIAMSVILFVTSIITALYWIYGSDKFQSANYILIVLSIIGLYESVGFMICINLVILLLVKEKEKDHDEKKEEIIEQIVTIPTEEIFKVIEEKEEDHGEKKKVTLEKIEKTKLSKQKEQEVISIIELKEPQIFVVPEPMKINLRLIEVDIKKLKTNVENTKNVTDFEVTTAILCQEAGLPNLNTEIYKGNEELFVNVIEQIEKAKVYFHETIILENSITEEVTFFLFFLFFPIAYLSGILSHNQNKKWELKRTIVNDLEIDIINRAISGLSTYPLDAKITYKKKLPGR
ncbi:hypothetical protein F8M41_010297 [Gigaspora margarita]|uniref:Uncharacterized protein n=1 Tax=Gigaspora margarita TaxID=4874 RepID=A0A8H4EQ69_GIGMA|nr:hypothetical protein F8M41_010297 [Gigaspora margarita]